jgi:uncharacterized membrane protein
VSIQRWEHFGQHIVMNGVGKYVTYADHVEALRQAEQRWSDLYAQASVDSGEQSVEHYRDGYQRAVVEERKKWQDFARDNWQSGYEQGQRDALAAVEKHAAEFLAEDDRVAHDVLMFVIAAILGDAPHEDPCDCDQCRTAVQG